MNSMDAFLSQYLVTDANSMTIWQVSVSFAVAYAGGILASLTPCVYPMIPLTVSVVSGVEIHSGASRREKWKKLASRLSIYIGGMALVYAFLGVLAGLTGRVFGTLTNTYGWYLALGIILSIAALIMMEVIPFNPIAWIEKFRARRKNQPPPTGPSHSWMSAFGMGATSGLVAAPCTTPILTGILAYIANTQSVVLGLLLMLSFALGLGTLLVLIAMFAGAAKVLPKSGGWLHTVKILGGLVLLALGGYLIYQAGSIR